MAICNFHMKTILVVTMAIFLSACSSTDKNSKQKAELYFGAGTQSLMTQDYTDALTNLLKANKLDPNNPGILNNLGMAYYFKDQKALAIKTLKQSLKINSDDNSDAKINLASIYFRNNDLKNAEKIYKSVLKDLTYEKQARTLYNLGILELKKNNSVAAENYFVKSLKEDTNFCPSYFQVGLLKYNQRQYKAALKNFKDATMGTCYESAPAHYYQALTYTHLKRFNEARLKYDEIDVRFKKSEYAVKARAKAMELNEIENNSNTEAIHASRKVLESPEF